MKKKNDQGNFAFLSALILTVLLGFSAICTDMALLYAEKWNLQNAVDASALAGAQELPDDPEAAIAIAYQYCLDNGMTIAYAEVSSNNKEILVSTEKNVSLHLAKILGMDSKIVKASARAAVLPAHTLVGAVPLSITMQDFIYGKEYTLKSAPPEGEGGWYGALRIDGQGSPTYEAALAYGSKSSLFIDQTIEVEHGNISGPTNRGLQTRLASDTRIPKNTFEDHDRNAPQIIYIPVVEVITKNDESIQAVKIIGFAAFFVEAVNGSGNDCFITGKFLKTLVSSGRERSSLADSINSGEGILTGDSPEFGLLTAKLLMN
jgi:hypothetical protein